MKLLLILPIASLMLAQVPAGHPMRGRANFEGRSQTEGRTAHLSKVLNLSAAQQQKAHELFQEEAVTSKGIGEKMKAQHDAMRDAIKRGATEDIDRIAQEGANAQAQVTAAHAKTMARLYSTLNEEQRKTFDAHPELMMGAGGRGPRPGGPDGGARAQRSKAPVQQ